MNTVFPDLAELKSRMKSMWMAGDFGQIATFSADEGEAFVRRIGIKPGAKVLDIACGTGNTAIPAAQAGGVVTGVDIATNLLAQARKRASAEDLDIRFDEGDAEELPYPDQSFDVVLSMFGAMFAPRPERAAAEMIRVCKPGGKIAMASWTPEGFVGQTFKVTAKMVPPPPLPPPVLWGDESVVRQRLGQGTSKIECTRQNVRFHYPFLPTQTVDFFRRYFGPTQTAFSKLDEHGQATLAQQLEALWTAHNTAHDGTTQVDANISKCRPFASSAGIVVTLVSMRGTQWIRNSSSS
jgi:ubiquinone/menaquinone biosynthesis C-methylase UbiE